MDWNLTARTTVPHVRQTIVDRELETWLRRRRLGEPRLRHRRLREARPRPVRGRCRGIPDRTAGEPPRDDARHPYRRGHPPAPVGPGTVARADSTSWRRTGRRTCPKQVRRPPTSPPRWTPCAGWHAAAASSSWCPTSSNRATGSVPSAASPPSTTSSRSRWSTHGSSSSPRWACSRWSIPRRAAVSRSRRGARSFAPGSRPQRRTNAARSRGAIRRAGVDHVVATHRP